MRIRHSLLLLVAISCSCSEARRSAADDVGAMEAGAAGVAGARPRRVIAGGADGAALPDSAGWASHPELAGQGAMPIPPQGCPSIACVNGAKFKADLPVSFEQAKQLKFEVCRNETCYKGQLSAAAEPLGGPGSGVGFRVPSELGATWRWFADVTFMNDERGGLHLTVSVMPWTDSDLREGDHYRVSARRPDGRTQILLDRRVEYRLNEFHLGGCYFSCHLSDLDLRGQPQPFLDDGVDAGL